MADFETQIKESQAQVAAAQAKISAITETTSGWGPGERGWAPMLDPIRAPVDWVFLDGGEKCLVGG